MIDWQRVSELRDEIGPEDFEEVVAIFLEEVEEALEHLEAGVEQSALESKLHFLKGSALNLGFSSFAKLCEKGEKAAKAERFEEIEIVLVSDAYKESREEFLADLSVRFAA